MSTLFSSLVLAKWVHSNMTENKLQFFFSLFSRQGSYTVIYITVFFSVAQSGSFLQLLRKKSPYKSLLFKTFSTKDDQISCNRAFKRVLKNGMWLSTLKSTPWIFIPEAVDRILSLEEIFQEFLQGFTILRWKRSQHMEIFRSCGTAAQRTLRPKGLLRKSS